MPRRHLLQTFLIAEVTLALLCRSRTRMFLALIVSYYHVGGRY